MVGQRWTVGKLYTCYIAMFFNACILEVFRTVFALKLETPLAIRTYCNHKSRQDFKTGFQPTILFQFLQQQISNVVLVITALQLFGDLESFTTWNTPLPNADRIFIHLTKLSVCLQQRVCVIYGRNRLDGIQIISNALTLQYSLLPKYMPIGNA